MSQAYADNPDVTINQDLSAQEAFHLTEDTFEGIVDLGDLLDDIPFITLAISTVKNSRSVIKGNKDIPSALAQVSHEKCVFSHFGIVTH
ncbi:MAG: hypothetical protein Q8J62_02870 [Candidatus Cloacimonadaceae bacterium]|nr:hypothetical protein [Candidatus Cloacimonadaceae bacterium]